MDRGLDAVNIAKPLIFYHFLISEIHNKKDDHAIAIQQVAAQVHGCLGQDLDRQSFSDAAD